MNIIAPAFAAFLFISGDARAEDWHSSLSEAKPVPAAPVPKTGEASFLADEPPAGAFVAARGWDRIEFSNESDVAVTLKAYLRMTKTGKWRQFRFPKDRQPRPRYFSPNSPAGKNEFQLNPGDRVGWRRYSRAEMAFQIFDSAGEDLSGGVRFRAERPTVAITKPDSWMRGEGGGGGARAAQPAGSFAPAGSGQPPGMGPSSQQGIAPAPGMGPSDQRTSGPADGQPN